MELTATLTVQDLAVQVIRKDIKRIYLRIYPPHGAIKVTAPHTTPDTTIKAFVREKTSWIKKKQARLQTYARQKPPMYTSGEQHYFSGIPHTLKIALHAEKKYSKATLNLHTQSLHVSFNPLTGNTDIQTLLANLYRRELKKRLPLLISKWSNRMHVSPQQVFIKKMKRKWGTCNPYKKRIWLNLELMKTPPQCLEYVFVHEMIHLLEANHSPRFYQLMEQFLPEWRSYETQLNTFVPGFI